MRLQDLTKDHLEILDNWEWEEIDAQIQRLKEAIETWGEFQALSRDEKDKLWDNAS